MSKGPIGHWGHCSTKIWLETTAIGSCTWKVVASLRFDVPSAVWCHCPQHPAGYSSGPSVPCQGQPWKMINKIQQTSGLSKSSLDFVKLWVQDFSDIADIVSAKVAWVPDVTTQWEEPCHPNGKTSIHHDPSKCRHIHLQRIKCHPALCCTLHLDTPKIIPQLAQDRFSKLRSSTSLNRNDQTIHWWTSNHHKSPVIFLICTASGFCWSISMMPYPSINRVFRIHAHTRNQLHSPLKKR